MINIKNKKDCCGCSACVQVCPKKCIIMKEDDEGFFYPNVNVEICINCGLCETVCPIINKNMESKEPLISTSVINIDDNDRMSSSSGGIFIALSRYIIKNDGVIFGATFDKDWLVKHESAENIEDVRLLMKSKYLQSRIENTYIEAKQYLKAGRLVMFVGTPCQIAGLKCFLKKDYENLLSVSILCHGVPSPRVWKKYLENICKKNENIDSISFRKKESYGWKQYGIEIKGNNGIMLSEPYNKNIYMKGFLSDLFLRPSCNACFAKSNKDKADITIADCWGIDKINPVEDDDKGMSLVMIYTKKGETFFSKLPLKTKNVILDSLKIYNGGFKENICFHPKRDYFFKHLNDEGIDINYLISMCLDENSSNKSRIKNKIKKYFYLLKKSK